MAIKSPKWIILAALVLTTPETPGVYELWEDEELVYVGATHGTRHSLREELVHHLLQQESGRLHATHFSWEITFDPAARKQELVGEYEAVHRHPPRFNEDARGESDLG